LFANFRKTKFSPEYWINIKTAPSLLESSSYATGWARMTSRLQAAAFLSALSALLLCVA
jgi:hypothetical protein